MDYLKSVVLQKLQKGDIEGTMCKPPGSFKVKYISVDVRSSDKLKTYLLVFVQGQTSTGHWKLHYEGYEEDYHVLEQV